MPTGNAKRFVEIGVDPRLAIELSKQITASTGNLRRLAELGMTPNEAKLVSAGITSGTFAGRNRLAETGLVPRVIREIMVQRAS